MSEIGKMYENAGIDYEERYNSCILNKEGECKLKCSCDICEYSEEKYIYPLFTAEKQIELLCFLINFGVEIIMQKCDIPIKTENIANNLAGITNEIWQDLSPEEKQQVKGILE